MKAFIRALKLDYITIFFLKSNILSRWKFKVLRLFPHAVDRPVSDTGQAGDRVASWYCQRCVVSSSRQNMSEMLLAISDDFWDALAPDQTVNTTLLAEAYKHIKGLSSCNLGSKPYTAKKADVMTSFIISIIALKMFTFSAKPFE